jgi:general stress protein 26
MSETLSEEEKQKRQEFFKLLKTFDTGMLVTYVESEKRLRARPMQVAEHDTNGNIWFVTSNMAPKVAEIRSHENVVVTFQVDISLVFNLFLRLL